MTEIPEHLRKRAEEARRKAAAKAGDPQGMALWAGQGHRMARELPAGQLVEVLAAEADSARAALALGSSR